MLLVLIADVYGKATVNAYHEENPLKCSCHPSRTKKTIPRFNNLSTKCPNNGYLRRTNPMTIYD